MDTLNLINRPPSSSPLSSMIDTFQRPITYLRVSVTDRCDFRCSYCMSENMTFLPKPEVLSLDELARLSAVFVAKGLKKLRLTGGEPLVRKDIMQLVRSLGSHLGRGLEELTLTTNGSQLARYADELYNCGIRRINVSLDTLDPEKFREITRRGDLERVMAGLEAAQKAGIAIKLNTVALKDFNDSEIPELIRFAHGRGMGITLIETMPLGDVGEDRLVKYLPLSEVRRQLEREFTLAASAHKSGGPARYFQVAETGGVLGLITPMTHNFCDTCNRVRLTSTGMLYMCLGQDDAADLRAVMRSTDDDEILGRAIDEGISRKPKSHDFVIDRFSKPAVGRHMNVTGG